MPLLVPFTGDELQYVLEIIGFSSDDEASVAEIQSKFDQVSLESNNAKATSIRRDIAQWKAIAYGTTKTRGGIKGTDFDLERDRLRITNLLRRRLGYSQLADSLNPNDVGFLKVRLSSWSASSTDEYQQ